jgi:hypothetical protein
MARTPKTTPATQGKWRRGMGNRPPQLRTVEDDAAAVARRDRQARTGDLRVLHRLSFEAIGKETGVSREQARLDYDAWFASNPSPRQAEVRAEEEPALLDLAQENRIARRMILQRMAERKRLPDGREVPAMGQDELLECTAALASLERSATRISESRRRLHGADAPEEKNVTHQGPDGGPIPIARTNVVLSEMLALMDQNEKAPE